jgi:hypothetical protein
MPHEGALTRLSDDALPSNSNVSKEEKKQQPITINGKPKAKKPEEKKFEKVITSKPIQKKQSLGKKLSDTFLGDNMHNVGDYVLFDVLIPAAKATISDMVSQGVEMLMFGESSSRSRNRKNGDKRDYTSYSSYYDRDRNSRNNYRTTRKLNRRASHNFDDIILESRAEAEEVLDNLEDSIVQYGYASVADLYDLVGITHNYTDQKWGWWSLSTASITRVREGYLLNLPKAMVLED